MSEGGSVFTWSQLTDAVAADQSLVVVWDSGWLTYYPMPAYRCTAFSAIIVDQ